ncbi:MAG: protein kinase [Butyrivibrio sp.]|nr:protein kinase [Butyrivibrio sp.]
MDVIREFQAYYDDSYEKNLPVEFTKTYNIMECLSSTGECDTLLVKRKKTDIRLVAKCYTQNSMQYSAGEPARFLSMKNEAIPRYIGEYRNENYYCILREYIEGISLNKYVQNNPLSETALAELAIQLVKAMQILHGSEPAIIHRDIKPENIIIKEDGSIALIDFGISRVFKADGDVDTVFCGTENYAPPEQYGFMQTDVRSDIYSFGIVISWLLTGEAKPIRNPVTRMGRIAAKCCEFAPNKRYRNDQALLRALYHATDNYRRRRRNWLIAAASLLILLSSGITVAGNEYQKSLRDKAYVFKEPLIEEAARIVLNKPEGIITAADLEAVTGIYIQAEQAYADEDSFYSDSGGGRWYNSTQRIKGPIKELSDIKSMPNIRNVYIGGNLIEDVSPLKELQHLQVIELRDNNIQDISPLEGHKTLENVRLNGNPLEGIDVVRTLPMLKELDLATTGSYDASVVGDLKDLNFLDIDNESDAWKYLDGLYVNVLRIRALGETDLECLKDTEYIRELYLCEAQIWDISALEGREDIILISLEQNVMGDLTPLFTMPNLATVKMSIKGREKMEELISLYGEPSFEIIYTHQ